MMSAVAAAVMTRKELAELATGKRSTGGLMTVRDLLG